MFRVQFVLTGRMVSPEAPPGDGPDVPGAAVVSVGCFGNITALMNEAYTSRVHTDLELSCDDGVLHCHRFVIGAQSHFLRALMAAQGHEDCAVVALPGVRLKHLRIVLKFLYTGKLLVRQQQVSVIRELLEKVLQVRNRSGNWAKDGGCCS